VTEHAFTNLDDDFTVPFDRFLSLPPVASAMAGLALGSTTPTTPLFVYHAVNDELVPIAGVTATVARYCAGGDPVTYTRDDLSEHLTLTFTVAPPPRLAGRPP
jgi:hypothetical protein